MPSPSSNPRTHSKSSETTSRQTTNEIPTTSIEEYLEAIYRLLRMGRNDFAKTGEIAEMLSVAPASVTQMIQKLANKDYVEYRKGRGVRLTRKGRRLAMDVLRRHRIAERLLVDLLSVSWEEAHQIACQWEHLLTPEMCERVLKRLEDPRTCPHGNPIPGTNGTLPAETKRSLADLDPEDEAIIDCISDENPELLRMMAAMGMLPGERVRVVQKSPMGDTTLIEVGTAQFALSKAIARCVRVITDDEDS